MAITKVTNSLVATNAIQGTLIADNAITSVHIAQNQVTSVQIPDSSITAYQLAGSSVGTGQLVNLGVTEAKIANNAVTSNKIATNSVVTETIAQNSITAVQIPDGSITETQLSSSAAPTFGNITTTGSLRGPASFTIDPAAVGDNTGTVVIAGDLQVDGNSTTINSSTLLVEDKNITLARTASTASAANTAGISVAGANADLTYFSTGDKWSFNKDLEVNGTITVNQNINSSTGNPLVLTGDGGANIELYSNGNAYFDATQLHLRGTNASGGGALAIAGTTVIDSNRNLTYIGTISSGAITSTGNITSSTTGTVNNAKLIADGGGAANVEIDRGSTSYHNNLLYRTAGAVKWRIWQSGADNILAIRNEVASTNVLSFTDTNATFAGTVSSGAITTSDTITSNDGSGSVVISGDSGSNTYIASTGEIRIRPSGTTVNKFVIGSNGNLTTAGTISSGAITSTGNIKTDYNDTISMDYASSSGAYHKGMSGTSFASGSTARGLHIFNYDNDSNLGINFWGGTNASKQLHATFDSKGNLRIGDQSTDLTGAKTSRSIVQVGVPRLTVGSAGSMCMAIYDVNTELSHTAGSAVSDAKGSKGTVWRSTSGQIYGPYVDLPRGQYRLSYRVKCNDNTSYENAMRLMVYSVNSGTVHTRVTERYVTCREFENTTDYQTFSIDFDVNADMGNTFEIYGFPQNSNQIDWDYAMITPETDSYSQRQRGIITKPNNPAFKATRATGNNWTVATSAGSYTQPFNVDAFDIGGNYSTSTYKFTAPIAGVYMFTHQCNAYGVGTDEIVRVEILVNGVTFIVGQISGDTPIGTGDQYATGSAYAYMSVGHTAEAKVNVLGGAQVGFSSDTNGVYNSFSGHLVG